jgi:hypothetical protein
VTACPAGNVGLIVQAPATHLWQDRLRSGIGRLSRRIDYAALVAVLVFAAFANAAGMVAPVVAAQESIGQPLGMSKLGVTTAFYCVTLLVLPLATITGAAAASRRLGRQAQTVQRLACRMTWSLVPLGFAMWLAHYSFHFFTSFDTIVPASQRFAADWGLTPPGLADWSLSCCRPTPDWLLKAEILALQAGLLGSLYVAWRIGCQLVGSRHGAPAAIAPWALLICLLFVAGLWILFQPMEMRGTMG